MKKWSMFLIVSLVIGWLIWNLQRSWTAQDKTKAFCDQFKIGDSVEGINQRAQNAKFDEVREFSLSNNNIRRLIFAQNGLKVGPFIQQARCRIDQLNGNISEIRFEVIDTTTFNFK